ncbi:MAG: hypothetical protein K2N78_12080 [Oscillospiraceae bacterium]|nr:hypothetical protein [Oscillospiraceae bacterium]
MNKKEKRLSTGFLVFTIFLFLCAVINFANGHIGAAICSLGADMFYLALSLADYEENQKSKENKR